MRTTLAAVLAREDSARTPPRQAPDPLHTESDAVRDCHVHAARGGPQDPRILWRALGVVSPQMPYWASVRRATSRQAASTRQSAQTAFAPRSSAKPIDPRRWGRTAPGPSPDRPPSRSSWAYSDASRWRQNAAGGMATRQRGGGSEVLLREGDIVYDRELLDVPESSSACKHTGRPGLSLASTIVRTRTTR
jgi:hypothetical protein